jgi:hypothetical protein
MKQYHTVAQLGSNFIITLYLDIVLDDSDGFQLLDPFQEALAEIAFGWTPIAQANNFQLVIVPKTGPVVEEGWPSPIGTVLFDEATPQDRIVFHNNPIALPSGVDNFFSFKVGVKDSTRPETQSAKISYTDRATGKGYIYSQVYYGSTPHKLGDISHELGHVFGLADRYYEAIVWYRDEAIDRNPKQIRNGSWYTSDNNDQRYAIPGTPGSADGEQGRAQDLPRYAERSSLLMAENAVPVDTAYVPSDNLMSTSSKKITPYQLRLIGIDNGQVVPPQKEPEIRKYKWVAILGDWITSNSATGDPSNSYGMLNAWESVDGLRYDLPGNLPNTTITYPYPCWNGNKKGLTLDGKNAVRPDLVTRALGMEMEGHRSVTGKVYKLVKSPATPDKRHWMRYTQQLLYDMTK